MIKGHVKDFDPRDYSGFVHDNLRLLRLLLSATLCDFSHIVDIQYSLQCHLAPPN